MITPDYFTEVWENCHSYSRYSATPRYAICNSTYYMYTYSRIYQLYTYLHSNTIIHYAHWLLVSVYMIFVRKKPNHATSSLQLCLMCTCCGWHYSIRLFGVVIKLIYIRDTHIHDFIVLDYIIIMYVSLWMWWRWAWRSFVCVIDIAWDRVFYEIYRHKHEGELPVYCIKYKDFSCLLTYIAIILLLLTSVLYWSTVLYSLV